MIDNRIGGWQHLSYMDEMGYFKTRADKIEDIINDLAFAKNKGENINNTQEKYFKKHGINMDSLSNYEREKIRNAVNRR